MPSSSASGAFLLRSTPTIRGVLDQSEILVRVEPSRVERAYDVVSSGP